MTQLSSVQARYVHKTWEEMRAAIHEFRKLDTKWNKLNDEMNARHDAQGTEFVQRAEDKSVNLTLQSYMDGAKWFRDKAVALAAVIQAEKAAMEMIKGDVSWDSPQPFSPLPEYRGSSVSPSA